MGRPIGRPAPSPCPILEASLTPGQCALSIDTQCRGGDRIHGCCEHLLFVAKFGSNSFSNVHFCLRFLRHSRLMAGISVQPAFPTFPDASARVPSSTYDFSKLPSSAKITTLKRHQIRATTQLYRSGSIVHTTHRYLPTMCHSFWLNDSAYLNRWRQHRKDPGRGSRFSLPPTDT